LFCFPGEASFGNRKLPKEFKLVPEDPVLSSRLPTVDEDGLDFRLASSTSFEEETPPFDDVFSSHPVIDYTASVNNDVENDVIEKRPLPKRRRAKRSPTGGGMDSKDEELPAPVFVSGHVDIPVGPGEATGDEDFIKHLFTSTVPKGRAGGLHVEATKAPGDVFRQSSVKVKITLAFAVFFRFIVTSCF
jgi:hypothetical protein